MTWTRICFIFRRYVSNNDEWWICWDAAANAMLFLKTLVCSSVFETNVPCVGLMTDAMAYPHACVPQIIFLNSYELLYAVTSSTVMINLGVMKRTKTQFVISEKCLSDNNYILYYSGSSIKFTTRFLFID